jgi:hypothetical protein
VSQTQWPMRFLTLNDAPPPGGSTAVLVVACPDCIALVAAPDLDEHRDKAHGLPPGRREEAGRGQE